MRTSSKPFAIAAITILVGSLAGTAGTASARSGATRRPTSQQGASAITPTADALAIANAIVVDPTILTGASFVAVPPTPPAGLPNAVSDSKLTFFPRDGSTYGILTSGDATLADDANTTSNAGTLNGGQPVRGDSDRDVTILKMDLNVPDTTNCLSVRFRFLSEEYPEFVGTGFNDAFIAELDNSTWTTSGSTISAPDNFAFDPVGNVVSINGTGNATVTTGNSKGTTYDAATQLLRASTTVGPGAHSLYLSIFDQGDEQLDSAVFLDKMDLIFADSPEACAKGTEADQINGTDESETIEGTEEDDLIFAGAGDDIVNGGGGADIIIAEDGNDTIIGGGGNDEILGGAGKDVLVGDDDTTSSASAARAMQRRGVPSSWYGSAQDEPPGDDTLNGGGGADEAFGGGGEDDVIGGGGSDDTDGEGGSDDVSGGKGNDEVKGGLGSDKMVGGPGIDTCYKGSGDTVQSCEEIFKRHRFYNYWYHV